MLAVVHGQEFVKTGKCGAPCKAGHWRKIQTSPQLERIGVDGSECPNCISAPADLQLIADAYNARRHGLPIVSGGLLDQPANFCEAMEIIAAVEG